jgi:hypothetical protein
MRWLEVSKMKLSGQTDEVADILKDMMAAQVLSLTLWKEEQGRSGCLKILGGLVMGGSLFFMPIKLIEPKIPVGLPIFLSFCFLMGACTFALAYSRAKHPLASSFSEMEQLALHATATRELAAKFPEGCVTVDTEASLFQGRLKEHGWSLAIGKTDGETWRKDITVLHPVHDFSKDKTIYKKKKQNVEVTSWRVQWILTVESTVREISEAPADPVKLVAREFEGDVTRLTFHLPLNTSIDPGLGYEGRALQIPPDPWGLGYHTHHHPEYVGKAVGQSLAWTFSKSVDDHERGLGKRQLTSTVESDLRRSYRRRRSAGDQQSD